MSVKKIPEMNYIPSCRELIDFLYKHYPKLSIFSALKMAIQKMELIKHNNLYMILNKREYEKKRNQS